MSQSARLPASPPPLSFDPTYGQKLEDLLRVPAPEAPADFAAFWERRYARARTIDPSPTITVAGTDARRRRVHDLRYRTTDGLTLGGWLVLPPAGLPRRAFVIGHGYGGGYEPDGTLPFDDAAIIHPCCRGLGRSAMPGIPSDPMAHVVQGIEDRSRYIHGGCVEDLWVAVNVIERLFPAVTGHIGLIGTSFGGGIGALALPCEARVSRAALVVPTFGNHPLRLTLPTTGSAAAVQAYARKSPRALATTLAYHDAAVAARFVRQPVLCACALSDPAVAPPGQFAIHNALAGPHELVVLRTGHTDDPRAAAEHENLTHRFADFFATL